MTDQYLTDRSGKVIGRLKGDGSIVDRSGKFMGHYDEGTDKTTTRDSRFTGKGDQRTRLISGSNQS